MLGWSLSTGNRPTSKRSNDIIETHIPLVKKIPGFKEYEISREPVTVLAVRWTRLMRQFGGLAKVDRVGFYAANCSVICTVA